MKRILVGVDGSEGAANALRWACVLAQATDAEVVVGTAGWHDVQNEAARENWSSPADEAGVRHRAAALRWEPGPALVETAESEDVDLLVVGHRAGALALGSVAMYVAHFARGPFAIVPAGALARRPQRIVVGLDGSDASRAAAEWAGPIALACGANVVAAHVSWPPSRDFFIPPDDEALAGVRTRLEGDWAAPLRSAVGTVETVVIEDGHPATVLLGLTGVDAADVLVIGTRRLGGLRQLRLGGVTMHLLHHTRVPVVVVPGRR